MTLPTTYNIAGHWLIVSIGLVLGLARRSRKWLATGCLIHAPWAELPI